MNLCENDPGPLVQLQILQCEEFGGESVAAKYSDTLIKLFIQLLNHPSIYLFVHSFVHPFIHSVHSSIRSFGH